MAVDIFDVRPMTEADCSLLAPRMRAAEVEECRASGDYSPLEALQASFESSAGCAWVALQDGEIACAFGAAPSLTGPGIAWLLTSDLVERYPGRFWRTCARALEEMLAIYPVLVNFIDARHTLAIRWASRLCGEGWPWTATLGDPETFGAAGLPFRLLTIRRAHV